MTQHAAQPALQRAGDRMRLRVSRQAQAVAAAVLGQLLHVLPRPPGQVTSQVVDVLLGAVTGRHCVQPVGQFALGTMQLAQR